MPDDGSGKSKIRRFILENDLRKAITALQVNLPRATRTAIMQALSSHQKLSSLLLKDSDQALGGVIYIIYQLLRSGETIDADLM